MHTLRKYPIVLTAYTCFRRLLTVISPTLNTIVTFRISKGKPIDLKNPKTFDEKLSWLKLNTYYKNPMVIKCADKYEVREYVSSCGFGELLNKLYGVYNSPEEINWKKLPDKFVLKWNNGCGLNIFCPDKNKLDIDKAVKTMKEWGRAKQYLNNAEMQYKYIVPKIVCEKLLEAKSGGLPEDYKFYCFHGKAVYAMICVGREKGKPNYYYYDKEWNLQRINKDSKGAPEDFYIPKPIGLHEMFQYAEDLSKPFPFVRVDFYNIGGKIFFGELTFTPSGGMNSNWLEDMDLMFGSLIRLPKQKAGKQHKARED